MLAKYGKIGKQGKAGGGPDGTVRPSGNRGANAHANVGMASGIVGYAPAWHVCEGHSLLWGGCLRPRVAKARKPRGLIVFVSRAMDNPRREQELVAPYAVETHPSRSVIGELAVSILVFRHWRRLRI